MIIEGLSFAGYAVAVWDVVRELARSQPLGAVVALALAADLLLGVFGALADRWEGVNRRPASRKATAPPACGAEPAR